MQAKPQFDTFRFFSWTTYFRILKQDVFFSYHSQGGEDLKQNIHIMHVQKPQKGDGGK